MGSVNRTILIFNNEPRGKMERIELQVSDPEIVVIGTNGPIRAQIEPYFDAISGKFTENYLVIEKFHWF